VALDKALYSASEELLDIVACFFAFHDMSDVPRKKQYPDVHHCVWEVTSLCQG
jgi:hypothetical protein